MRPLIPVSAGFVLAALLAAPARASDGVLEINQTCATQTGCFTGDNAGFPVTITDTAPAKSFHLTSDLHVNSVNATTIAVQTSFVRIDLGGFTVSGPVSCSGSPLVCSGNGVGDGVAVDTVTREGVEVRNGAVFGMGDFGVFVGNRGVVENVRALQNGGNGIQASASGAVRGCTAALNGEVGIVVGAGGLVSGSAANQNALQGLNASSDGASLIGNSVRFNGAVGISTTAGSVVVNNTSADNALGGITTGIGATVSDNSVLENLADGIVCSSRCTLSGNTVNGNGNATDEDGIECGLGCAARANTVSLNRGFGLNLGNDSVYRDNVITGNGTGTATGGVNRGDNYCAGIGAGSTTCP